jgi:hypothetical protein
LTLAMGPKTIQELFTADYGRMNATLGVELPNTNMTIQTTIPYGFIDPPTELLQDSVPSAPLGTLGDGTQIWKITHNGVDTHVVHFHLFDVQVVNRVGWDGAIKPPLPNEIGWKDTVVMNPLEDIIVALRPLRPVVPWDLPNNFRTFDVTTPVGSSMGFFGVDPTGQPVAVTNQVINFGYDYVWHCHILGHEENDMMRSMVLVVAPVAPSNLTGTALKSGNIRLVRLSWTDTSKNETEWIIQRAASSGGPWTSVKTVPSTMGPATGATITADDTTVQKGTLYYYRVLANNVAGDTTVYAAPAVGYPTMSASSAPSGTFSITTP